MTGQQLIEAAMRKAQLLGEGESASSDQLEEFRVDLNMLIKTLQADGLNLWVVDNLYLWPLKGLNKYELLETTVTTGEAASAGSDALRHRVTQEASAITIPTDIGGLASSILIPIPTYLSQNSVSDLPEEAINTGTMIGLLDSNNQLIWSSGTVSSSGGQEYVSHVGGSAKYSAGDTLYFYNNLETRKPKRILEAYAITDAVTKANIPLSHISRTEYGNLQSKTATGNPTQYYFDPQIGDRFLYIWPQVSSEATYVHLVGQSTIDDIDDVGNDIYCDQEWYMVIMLGLAELMAMDSGLPDPEYRKILRAYERYYMAVEGFDRENGTSITIEPDL